MVRGSYALWRSNLKSYGDADVAKKSVAYGKRVKVYPLPQAANPPPTVFGVKGSRQAQPQSGHRRAVSDRSAGLTISTDSGRIVVRCTGDNAWPERAEPSKNDVFLNVL